MAKPRYYEPQAIQPHPRVQHRPAGSYRDQYVGELQDLIEACVLQQHMAPPRISLAWRPEGVPQANNEAVHQMPGYLTVTKRPDGLLRVTVAVSREERAARCAEDQQRRAISAAEANDARLEAERVRAAFCSTKEYREMLTHFLRIVADHLGGHRSAAPYEYALAEDAAVSVQYAVSVIEDAIISGRIVVADKALAGLVAARGNAALQSFLSRLT